MQYSIEPRESIERLGVCADEQNHRPDHAVLREDHPGTGTSSPRFRTAYHPRAGWCPQLNHDLQHPHGDAHRRALSLYRRWGRHRRGSDRQVLSSGGVSGSQRPGSTGVTHYVGASKKGGLESLGGQRHYSHAGERLDGSGMAEREALRDEPLPRRGRRRGACRGGAVRARPGLRRGRHQTLAQPHDPAGHRRSPDRESDALARTSEGWFPGHGVPLEAGRRKRRSDTCRRGAGPMKIKRVDHLGVIVGDLEGAVQSFTEHLGLELDHVEQYGDELDIAFLPCGETLVELIKPLKEGGSNADYLREQGPGIQHVAFEVENLDAALTELSGRGVELLGDAPVPGAGGMRIAFLDPQAFGGILVELCEPTS